jgi:hypothetical protein
MKRSCLMGLGLELLLIALVALLAGRGKADE